MGDKRFIAEHRGGMRRVTRHPYKLAPRYPDITCRDLTLGPLYFRAVRLHEIQKQSLS